METTIHDEFFGLLTWEPLYDYWEDAINVPSGSALRVYVSTPDAEQD